MAYRKKIKVRLQPGIYDEFPEDDLHAILRGADELIFTGGRTLLSKLLKGSKDKHLLSQELDDCPVYGYFSDRTLKDIQARVDWVMDRGYLTYDYDGHLPLLVHTERGWEMVKELRINEFLSHFDIQLMSEEAPYDMFYLKDRNEEMIFQFLDRVEEMKDTRYLVLLEDWRKIESKNVRQRIEAVLAAWSEE
ncbi:MAG: RQC-minor-1 family DNA-binding protein [Bacteroidota bacterium]